jgi:hypothetical protein
MTSIELQSPATLAAAPAARPRSNALSECGLWLRVGFGGASIAAIGIIEFLQREADLVPSLPFAAAGAALAVYSWRRARSVLDEPRTD